MKGKLKDTVSSGAIITFLNGLFFNLIQPSNLTESIKEILVVYVSTPLSLILTWLILIVIKVAGDFKPETILLNRATNKEIKQAKKTIKNPKSSPFEIEMAQKDLKSFLHFKRKNVVKRLNKLAKESEEAKSSTDQITTKI